MLNADAIGPALFGLTKPQLFMVGGRILQATRNGKFLNQLAKEVDQLRKSGQIKDDYINTEQALSSMQELPAALENPPVDDRKFNLLKAIFLNSAKEKLSDRDDPTPQLLMSIARDLTGGEIILLEAVNRIRQKKTPTDVTGSATKWRSYTAENSELSGPSMVEYYEDRLVEKKLLAPRRDDYSLYPHNAFRLTDPGIKLCQMFVTDAEES